VPRRTIARSKECEEHKIAANMGAWLIPLNKNPHLHPHTHTVRPAGPPHLLHSQTGLKKAVFCNQHVSKELPGFVQNMTMLLSVHESMLHGNELQK